MTERPGEADYLRAVGLRVRLTRMARRLSQDELARRAEVSRVTLGAVERGEHGAQSITFHRLAAALDVEIGGMVSGQVSPL